MFRKYGPRSRLRRVLPAQESLELEDALAFDLMSVFELESDLDFGFESAFESELDSDRAFFEVSGDLESVA